MKLLDDTRVIMAQRAHEKRARARLTPPSFAQPKLRSRSHKLIARSSISFGVIALLAEWARHLVGIEHGHLWPVTIGLIFLFIGAFMENRRHAIEAGDKMVDWGVAFVAAARGGSVERAGRRRTDPIVVTPSAELPIELPTAGTPEMEMPQDYEDGV